MEKSLLISLLKTELTESEREAARLRQVAEDAQAEAVRLESLATSIRATVEGINSKTNQEKDKEIGLILEEIRQPPTQPSTKNTLDNDGAEGDKGSAEFFLSNGGSNHVNSKHSYYSDFKSISHVSRNPKDYQRPEYKGQRGYIQIAKPIIEKHPEGLHIGQLVEIIFDYQSSEEFVKAKRSLQAELARAVKENRLRKLGDYYYHN
jgi:hypothetical protein